MATFTVLLALIGMVIALFWIALPFLVNGTNSRLDKLIAEVKALRTAIEQKQIP